MSPSIPALNPAESLSDSAKQSTEWEIVGIDVSRSDNEALARSARDVTKGLQTLSEHLPGKSEAFTKQLLRIVFKFAGEPQTVDIIESIYKEAISNVTESSSSSSSPGEELP